MTGRRGNVKKWSKIDQFQRPRLSVGPRTAIRQHRVGKYICTAENEDKGK